MWGAVGLGRRTADGGGHVAQAPVGAAIAKTSSPVKGGAASSHAGGLGLAPPCSQFESLLPLSELEAMSQDVYDSHSNADIVEKKKAFSNARAPLSDLLAASAAALRDIAKVDTARALAKKTSQAGPTGAKPQSAADGASKLAKAATPHLFTELLPMFVEYPRCDGWAGVKHAISVDKPLLVPQDNERHKEMVAAINDKGGTNLKADLAKQTTQQRAEEPLSEDCANLIITAVKRLCPDDMAILCGNVGATPASQTTAATIAPCMFAIEKSAITFGCERHNFSALRISLEGTRVVVMTEWHSLARHVVKLGAGDSAAAEPDWSDPAALRQKCSAFLRNAKQPEFEAFVESEAKPTIYAGTVGPSDTLFVPAGFFFAELVTGQGQAFGLRVPALSKSQRIEKFFKDQLDTLKQKDKDKTPLGVAISGYTELAQLNCTARAL